MRFRPLRRARRGSAPFIPATFDKIRSARRLLDGDEAGQNAAARIEKQLVDAGFMVMNCLLPEGEDPDSLFHRYGKEGFCTIFRESAYNRRRKRLDLTTSDVRLVPSGSPSTRNTSEAPSLIRMNNNPPILIKIM